MTNLPTKSISWQIIVLLIGLSFPTILQAKVDSLANLVNDRMLEPAPEDAKLTVTHLGVSTFVFDDGDRQIILDGYFSRNRGTFFQILFGKIAPDLDTLPESIQKYTVARYATTFRSSRANCGAGEIKRRSVVVPLHAHYDHAMDSAFVAAYRGSCLIADQSIALLWDASKEFWKAKGSPAEFQFDDNQLKTVPGGKQVERFQIGEFQLTLFPMKHLQNGITKHGSGSTDGDFEFPSKLFDMKEGAVYAAHIRWRDQSFLIVASAGEQRSDVNYTGMEANVVFLGAYGLSIEGRSYRKQFWEEFVIQTDPDNGNTRVVVPVHWDKDNVDLELFEQKYTPAPFGGFKRVFNEMIDFGCVSEDSTQNVAVAFAPIGEKLSFDAATFPKACDPK